MAYTPEQIATLRATDPKIVRQALERMSESERSELMQALKGGNAQQPAPEPQLLASHAVTPEMQPSHTTGAPLPESVTQVPGPETTAAGLAGAAARGLGPYAAAAPAGPVGVAAMGAAKLIGDPLAQGINSLKSMMGLDPYIANQMSPSQFLNLLMDKIGIHKPQTSAERVVQAGAEAAGSGLGTVALGQQMAKSAAPVVAGVGRTLAAQPVQQVVGGAGAGLASQTAAESGAGLPGQIAAGLAGGMLGAKVATPRAALTEAYQLPAIAEAEKVGIPVMTTDVMPPRTFASKWLQSMGEKIPYVGTGGPRQAQQAQRVEAVKKLLGEYGASPSITPEDASKPLAAVFSDLVERRSGQLSKYAGMKKEVIERLSPMPSQPAEDAARLTWKQFTGQRMGEYMKTEGGHSGAIKKIAKEWSDYKAADHAKVPLAGTVPMPKTTAALDSEISRLKSLNNKDANDIVTVLEDWKTSIQNQSLSNIEALRAQIGQSFEAPSLAGARDMATKSLSGIYKHVRDDMGDFISANGQRKDFVKWSVANKRLSEMSGEIETGALRSILKSGKVTPEDAGKMLFSSKPSEVRQIVSGLSPTGRENAKIAVMAKVAEQSGGVENLSPEKFVASTRKLGSQIGLVFDGDEIDRIRGISRALQLTSQASKASLVTPTGLQGVPIVGTALLTDLLGSGGAAVATIGTVGGLARAYESAPVRNLLMNLAKTKAGSPEEAALFKRLIAVSQSQQATKQENE